MQYTHILGGTKATNNSKKIMVGLPNNVKLSNLTCNFITSPHAGAPTSPVPTSLSFLSKDPTFLGFS